MIIAQFFSLLSSSPSNKNWLWIRGCPISVVSEKSPAMIALCLELLKEHRLASNLCIWNISVLHFWSCLTVAYIIWWEPSHFLGKSSFLNGVPRETFLLHSPTNNYTSLSRFFCWNIIISFFSRREFKIIIFYIDLTSTKKMRTQARTLPNTHPVSMHAYTSAHNAI